MVLYLAIKGFFFFAFQSAASLVKLFPRPITAFDGELKGGIVVVFLFVISIRVSQVPRPNFDIISTWLS